MTPRKESEILELSEQLVNLIKNSSLTELGEFLDNLTEFDLRRFENYAFSLAAEYCHAAIPVLLKHGADPTHENAYGQNALTHLLNHEEPFSFDTVIALIQHGIHPNTPSSSDLTVYHKTAQTNPGYIPFLLNKMRLALKEPLSAIPILCKMRSSELTFIRKLSEGSFGKVYLGTWHNNYCVAIKRIDFEKTSPELCDRERFIMQKLAESNAENVVRFYGYAQTPEAFFIVMQYCKGGTLWGKINHEKPTTWPQRLSTMRGVANGLSHLHQLNFVHSDLHSANILFYHDGQPKIGDFGQARSTLYRGHFLGIIHYAAPELIANGSNTKKTDIWSLSCIFWELSAWRSIDTITDDQKSSITDRFTPSIAKLVTWGFKKEPTERPSAIEARDELDAIMKTQFGNQ